ncbi:hypothetical protein FBD94_14120 [Pedobacter hiemivivus]|uniref:Sulfotransferase family protein n=1 Tax=Pedobacter hiemivivus TaxID=2530454 RepID=A0A4U1GBF7_9SPHI|nr:hypothetical protein [Pedobacter hiemivivus]TKC60053.1 hypothetical protein FBD94_14120 [Pedobacter hiemivivus]
MNKDHPLKNWIPYQFLYDELEGWKVTWMDLQDSKIVEPFFDETIMKCRSRRAQKTMLKSFSSPDFMKEVAENIPHLKPNAFIFHVSRCGSTLVTQAFCEMDENIVIAEAPLLDEILRASEKDDNLPTEKKEAWFKAALNLMGQHRNSKETGYIIKLDSWHIHFYELLRSWFPDTPFFFLSRRPDEVLASHEKRRGIHAVPGMVNKDLLKIDASKEYGGDFNSYTADVLEHFFLQMQYIQRLGHPKNAFTDYGDGVFKMLTEFSAFAGISIHNPERIYNRLNYHSKAGQELFKKDKTAEIRHYYHHCMEAYIQFKNY